MSLLAITLALPLIGFFVVLFTPRDSKGPFVVAIVASVAAFLTSLGLIGPAHANSAQFSSTVNSLWIDSPGLHIRFHLGIDGINLWLVLLTTLLLPIGIWVSRTMIHERQKNFFALLLLFEFGLIGVFSALDLFVFYVFWEVALVPMYLMVGGWGAANRGPAAVKFFVYTFLGSVLMLVSIIYIYTQAGTFDYVDIMNALGSGRLVLSPLQQLAVFLGFCGICGEGADFPTAHVVTRNLHASACARNVLACCCDVEDGGLWTDSLLFDLDAHRRASLLRLDRRACNYGDHLRSLTCADSAQYQAADCLLFGQPFGIHRARDLFL